MFSSSRSGKSLNQQHPFWWEQFTRVREGSRTLMSSCKSNAQFYISVCYWKGTLVSESGGKKQRQTCNEEPACAWNCRKWSPSYLFILPNTPIWYLFWITVGKWLIGDPQENPHSEIWYLCHHPFIVFSVSWEANRIYTSNYYCHILIQYSSRLPHPKKGIAHRQHIYNSGSLLQTSCWKSVI